MPSSARSFTFQHALRRLRAELWVLLWLAVGGVRLVWFLVFNLRLTLATLPRAQRARKDGPLDPAILPLIKLSEGVYTPRVEPHSSPRERKSSGERVPLVLHFTGTGESVYAAFEVDLPLCAAEPSLRNAAHYVFQAPAARGAYYGPHVFASAMWERVAPVVEHYEGPFVLIGLSRGGLVALELGMRIVTELGKVASVLCLSAPVDVPAHIPRAVHAIAGFENMLQQVGENLPRCSRLLRQHAESTVQRIHLLLTSLILSDFEIDDPRQLQLQLAELAENGVLPGSLRAAREFRLLLEATRRDGQLFCKDVAHTAATGAGRLYAALLWGERDSWIEAKTCQAQVREAMAREPEHDWLHTELVPDQGHALLRTRRDKTPIVLGLRRVAERALLGAANRSSLADRSQKLETLLLERTAEEKS